MKYSLNLVRTLRIQEKKAEILQARMVILTIIAVALLVGAVAFSTYQIFQMEAILEYERNQVARIEDEYKQYKSTEMIVNRSDVELLNSLQNRRIFWTKKLAAMAHFLPENYWITEFGYDIRKKSFDVDGYGYITKEQKQLITIDEYLNYLREDDNFSDVLKNTYLNETSRKDEESRERIKFNYSALGSK